MVILVINNESCLNLNLSNEFNFILIFLLKSYTTFYPNFIGKFVQKSCTFIRQSWFKNQTSSFNSFFSQLERDS